MNNRSLISSDKQLERGLKVKLTFKPNITGIIIDTRMAETDWSMWNHTRMQYLVMYDGNDVVPTQDWHYDYELDLIQFQPATFRCECGRDSAGTGDHSSWCPKASNG